MTEGYKGTIRTQIPHILATKNSALEMKTYVIPENCTSLPAVVNINMSINKIVFYNVSVSLFNITKAVQSIQKLFSSISQLLHQGGTINIIFHILKNPHLHHLHARKQRGSQQHREINPILPITRKKIPATL
jgi:hypothetical protein